MQFCHSREIWSDYAELVPGVLFAEGITHDALVEPRTFRFNAIAESRLASSSEGELPEVQAWRRTFSKMGLKPTQYRCASESLLRRFKKEKSLPHIHPIIDLCNAISLAFAIPIAVFDASKIEGSLEVRYAAGTELYSTFSGTLENPEPREVIFADQANRAHARRWTNRQSAHSAISNDTHAVLIVAEALHATADTDVRRLVATAADELHAVWALSAKTGILSLSSPVFSF
ncbi:B3/4 domain-containing protein [Pendulispora albinea]|uniref:B3/B4 tRNA-binding domain-containing protein n=1 Tax=Pendulispora albinea TaxID=2741071 RepID=A0ABZ2LT74_9BACT